MEKIKASDILAMNESLTIEELRKFKFFAIDSDGTKAIFKDKPKFYGKEGWDLPRNYFLHEVSCICEGEEITEHQSKNSLREVDFSEEENQHDYYPLFLHLSEQHDLTLTDEELHEIVLLARKIKAYETDI